MSKINSLNEYIQKILSINNKNNQKGCSVYYRGENRDYLENKCTPGIFRKKRLIINEHNIFKEMIIRNPDDFEKDKSTFDKLSRMQHYGTPTRLLDITSNALLALFFACKKRDSEKDGIVYIFNIPNEIIKFYDSDTVSVIANLAKREKFDFPSNLENCKEAFNKHKDIQFLLHNIKDEKPYFKNEIVPKHLYSIVCVKPILNNRRIIRQQGAFLLFGNNKYEKYKPAKLNDSKISLKKIEIEKTAKNKILKELEILGISNATAFPDISNVSEYLKEKYSSD